MTLETAQLDMRRAYFGGAPIVCASGLIWFVAGWVQIVQGTHHALMIFMCAMLLCHPLGITLMRELLATGRHDKRNPLPRLTSDANIFLVAGLAVAVIASQESYSPFFPIALFVFGARYLILQTVYGLKVYWLLGGGLIVASTVAYSLTLSAGLTAFLGAYIELSFAGWMFWQINRSSTLLPR